VPVNPKVEGGPQMSVVWGDPMKGPGAFFLKTAPGTETPIHAHSSDYYAVVVKGAPAHGLTKVGAKVLEPGSQWYQPAKEMHYDGCTGATDCIVLVNLTGKFDFIPQPAPKAK
jgi:anti-sigma factor ChrR (cupin superfamily)